MIKSNCLNTDFIRTEGYRPSPTPLSSAPISGGLEI